MGDRQGTQGVEDNFVMLVFKRHCEHKDG